MAIKNDIANMIMYFLRVQRFLLDNAAITTVMDPEKE